MSALFSGISLRGLKLVNRIVVSPMCQYSARDGSPGSWHIAHLGALAGSGAGLLMLEATAVEPEGRISPRCLGLYCDDNERALGQVLKHVRRVSDVPIGIQLGHAGRKGSSQVPWKGGGQIPQSAGGWPGIAPSALAHGEGDQPPRALDREGLKRVREAFVHSARRARRLGLQAIELHLAHGYLLHQFLSPLANHRSDDYGGSLANRMRFPLEVFDAVRAALGSELPLGVRVSASDWVDGGWDLAQTIELAHALESRGCDWIDVSSGGISPQQKIALGPGYQIPFARAIREATGLTTMGVGLITEAQQAEQIIADGEADLVALARGLLWNPRWPWHAAAALGASVRPPDQYLRCEPRDKAGVFDNSPRKPG